MKISIWVFTGHLSVLNDFIKGYDVEDIDWLKFPGSVGTDENRLLYCQVQLSYRDFERLESEFIYQDLT
jgi:hypothetical protein